MIFVGLAVLILLISALIKRPRRCNVCGNELRRTTYEGRINGRKVKICTHCTQRVERENSRVAMNQIIRPQSPPLPYASGGEIPKRSRGWVFALIGIGVLFLGVCGLLVLSLGAVMFKTAGTQVAPTTAVAPSPSPSPRPSVPPHQGSTLPTPASLTTPPPAPTSSFTEQVAASQRRAAAKYPDLGKAGSVLNSSFVARVRLLQIEKNPRLQQPNWPEAVADEIAHMPVSTALTLPAPAPLATTGTPFVNPRIYIGVTEAALKRSLGQPISVKESQSPDGPFRMLIFDNTPGRETFFTIFASDGKTSSGYYHGAMVPTP